MKLSVLILLTILALLVAPAGAQTATPAEQRLSEAIVLSARPGELTDDPTFYLHRAVALARLAREVDPANRQAPLLQAEACEALAESDQAADALWRYLELIDFRDHQATARWMSLRLSQLQSAEQRIDLLASAGANPSLPAPARALALANQAVIEQGRGRLAAARSLCREALRMDDAQSEAVLLLARLDAYDAGQAEPVRRAGDALALLRANPRSTQVAWELGKLLRNQGLYQLAYRMYEHAANLAEAGGLSQTEAFAEDRLNALIDAEQYAVAVRDYEDRVGFGQMDPDILMLLHEAYAGLDASEQAEDMVDRLEQFYSPLVSASRRSARETAELAWFSLMYADRPLTAQEWAQDALRRDPNDPIIQRIWAMSMLAVNQPGPALPQLHRLAEDDTYAAAALAGYYLGRGEQATAQNYLDILAGHSRAGRPWRYVKEVCTRHGVAPPAAPASAEEVRGLIEAFDPGYLEMARNPVTVLEVTLTAESPTARPGDPIAVVGQIRNIGRLPVPLGADGLVSPRMLVTVRMPDSRNPDQTFEAPLEFAAPRYLAPGQAIRSRARLDYGALARELSLRPLESFTLECSAVIDPVQRDGQTSPALRALQVEPIRLTRQGLIEQPQPDLYYNELIALVGRFRGQDPLDAMSAGQATGQVAGMAQSISQSRFAAPLWLRSNLYLPQALSMLRHCLGRTPPEVAGATLLGMHHVQATGLVNELLVPAINHQIPAVRALAIDYLGQHGDQDHARMLSQLGRSDASEPVRRLAALWAERLSAQSQP